MFLFCFMQFKDNYSEDEISLFIDRWRKSGLSQVRFCGQNQISVRLFRAWLRREHDQPDTCNMEFSIVEIDDEPLVDNSVPVEIVCLSGVRVQLGSGLSLVELSALIKLL